ncbi:MAG: DUF1566 domain-containing protein [Candidatus Electrothrix sp. ATG2]|nr:DUF1566 domain-containing protein [Candidatus Electrothrix sp. ATG2]
MRNIHPLIFFLLLLLFAQPVYSGCDEDLSPTTPDSQFDVDNVNGVVTDKKTGLIWKKCLSGQTGSDCSGGAVGSYNWTTALGLASDGWRLPNIKELQSIVEEQCFQPAINETIFPSTPAVSNVWSNSPDSSDITKAWYVTFHGTGGNGYGNTLVEPQINSSNMHVRLVRDTPLP